MPWSVYNSNGKLLQSLAIGDDSIVEGKLDVSNAPTNGYFLQAQSGEGGGLTWAAASSGPSQATQAALEAATNEDTYAPPDLMHHHPGMVKVWGIIGGGGDLKSIDYNVASVTDTGAGDRMIIFTVAFSSTLYCSTIAMASADTSQFFPYMNYLGSASQIRHTIYSGDSAAMGLADMACSFMISGDQS